MKRLLLSHLYLKTIILPRQARDIHRENSKKDTFPHQYYALDRGDDDHDNNDYLENCRATLDAGLGTVASVRSKGELDARRQCEKHISFVPFYAKKDHFTRTGSGQT